MTDRTPTSDSPHARALLTSTPEGATAYLDADLHDPGHILEQAATTLDFTQPVALTLLGWSSPSTTTKRPTRSCVA